MMHHGKSTAENWVGFSFPLTPLRTPDITPVSLLHLHGIIDNGGKGEREREEGRKRIKRN